ncbi:aminoacyltransferase [Staphylococcus warneri]|uniref:Aminoacyltransferase FemA n=3 Tax=Staphylococcus TaxID=1279 RepID=A0A364USY0_STAWA|nr:MULTISPECIES: aminoacyltransferase [Staphylococcus]AGC91649.1 epr protein [Staphylococcus warneri SG1]PAK72980.1 aminoacyltransferase [Staphylococcus pasteuri]EGG97468.1 putative aminoacyltransferase FemA [Staphylococcus warneri VCU121]KEK50659.1 femAB family protein [Staphylococcus warneri Lyso 1 2011]KEK57569.1 femAB family protein [Staphylococcus warneri Lyso 2 2011]
MYFTRLTETEYDNFIQNNKVHFTQCIDQFKYRKTNGEEAHLVGVKNNENEVIAACLLTESRALKFFKYFYSQKGPILDFNNLELVKCFFKGLTTYLQKKRALFASIDPYILENVRNTAGDIVTPINNKELIHTLHQLGYQHQGLTIGYSQKSQIRWLSVLDMEGQKEEDVLKNMEYKTRRHVQHAIEMGVKTITLDISEIDRFYQLFKMAEERHHFKYRANPYQFFKEVLLMYPNEAMIKLSYINLDDYKNQLIKKSSEIAKDIENTRDKLSGHPNSKKSKNKLKQLEQQWNSNEKKITETQDIIQTDGHVIDLAAALYIATKDEVYYLSSGSNPHYYQYKGAYALQWHMIKFAIKHEIPKYNFYGITGDFSKTADDLGVQQFKKGFGTHIEELIGDFIKPIHPLLYKVFRLLNE